MSDHDWTDDEDKWRSENDPSYPGYQELHPREAGLPAARWAVSHALQNAPSKGEFADLLAEALAVIDALAATPTQPNDRRATLAWLSQDADDLGIYTDAATPADEREELRIELEDLRDNGYQPSYNGRPSCPFCLNFVDAEETHSPDCVLVAALTPVGPRPPRGRLTGKTWPTGDEVGATGHPAPDEPRSARIQGYREGRLAVLEEILEDVKERRAIADRIVREETRRSQTNV